MGGGAFVPLKTGLPSGETAKQVEICFAILLKILAIPPGQNGLPNVELHAEVVSVRFPGDMANWSGAGCLPPGSQSLLENGAGDPATNRGNNVGISIALRFYTLNYMREGPSNRFRSC
jgi:hypothetical protein